MAPYPSLHQALIAKAALNKQREWIRLQLVRNMKDYETAKRLSAAIRSADLRHYSLEALARLAPSLEQKLDHLSALYSPPIYREHWVYSNTFVVRPYAVDSSVKIRDFVLAQVPLEERPGVLV